MINIELEDGFEEVVINNDESRTFKFNPSDYNIIGKLVTFEKRIKEKFSKFNFEGSNEEETWEKVLEMDKTIKEELDNILGKGTSDAVFNGTNCLLSINGEPVIFTFFEKIAPIITERIEKEVKESEKKIYKYTSKYENPKAQENYEKLIEDTTK